jgi:hypothetical protein
LIRRTWLLLVSLAVTGCIAGTAIAGLPDAGTSAVVVLDPTIITAAQAEDGQVVTPDPNDTLDIPVPVPTDSIDLPIDESAAPASDESSTTTVTLASEPPVVSVTDNSVTTDPVVVQTTFAAPPAETPVTDDIPVITVDPAPDPNDVDRSTMRLVIANADGRDLAPGIADQLFGKGYEKITVATANDTVQFTTIYYRDGFNASASLVGLDLDLEDATLLEYPVDAANPLTSYDDLGDVIILLGSDIPG